MTATNGLSQESHRPGERPGRRVVVKAGTSVLNAGTDRLDLEAMAGLVSQLARVHKAGTHVLLVTSGAVAAGRHRLSVDRARRDIPFRQALAAVGQGRLMQVYEQLFDWHGIPVGQALITRDDAEGRHGYMNVRAALHALLDLGVVPVINENDVVAVEELGLNFGDNDRLSALVANLVEADLLIILSDVKGLYTADPRTDPSATFIPRVDRVDAAIAALAAPHRSATSRGGMETKLEAARLATASGTSVVVCDGREPHVIERLVAGESVGTLFPATTSPLEARRRRMLALPPRGDLVVDDGARKALLDDGKSLLPVGVKEVRGKFERGDVVYLTDLTGNRFAVGIANYASAEAQRLKGVHSAKINAVLGEQVSYGAELVHRDNMVLLQGA